MAFAHSTNRVYGATVAAEDLDGKRYLAGNVDANGEIAVATGAAGEAIDGIILDESPAGISASICTEGVERVILGGTVAIGDEVAVDANAKFVVAASGAVAVGKALVGGDADAIGTIMFYGKSSTTVA